MKILEVRDSFIKIESENKVSPSSFLQIDDSEKSYIAQVIQTKPLENLFFVFAKILFIYDGTLKTYDKSLPDKSSTVSEFTFDILNKSIEYTNPIIAGKFIDGGIDIVIDKECFNKKMLACIDSPKANNRVVSNLSRQFASQNKVVIIDMLGVIEGQKYVAGVDFKLPLNTESLEFMYEDCLNDATSDSKSLIKEIFGDLSEYSKSVPFLPFGTLKSIIDDMVDKQHIFKLLVLKNKLAKFADQGYFALTANEANNLNKILEEDKVVIDLSKLDTTFQNRYLETIYSSLDSQTVVMLEASNALNKKNIKHIFENKTSTLFITHSKFKYINEIKSLFDNFIIEPNFTTREVFKIYSVFLNSMPKESYLLVGEGTNYIPLVSSLDAVLTVLEPNSHQEESKEEEKEELETPSTEVNEDSFGETVSQDTEDLSTEKAIEKKSEELIEKLSEDVVTLEQEETTSIFSDDEDGFEEDNLESIDNTETQPETFVDFKGTGFTQVTPSLNKEEEESVEITNEIEQAEDSEVLETIEVPNELEIIEDAQPQEVIEEAAEEEFVAETITEEICLEEIESVEEKEEEILETEIESSEIIEDIQEEELVEEIEIPEEISDLTEEIELESIEMIAEVDEITDTEEIQPEYAVIEENLPNDDSIELKEISDIDSDTIKLKDYSEEDYIEEPMIETPIESETEVEEFSELLPELDNTEDELKIEEIVEIDDTEINDDTIIVDFEDNEEELSEEDLDKQIVEDVDKVFTTIKEDTISDSDLDFIDELNNEDSEEFGELEEIAVPEDELPEGFGEETEDEGFLEPLEEVSEIKLDNEETEILESRDSKPPIVPVYEANIPQEDIVMSDPIEQGDVVTHATYGIGTVEKMIKYGTKTLYSINFDNVGRRLLDPTLTEIKKG